MNMIERVARGMAVRAGFDPDHEITEMQPYRAHGSGRLFWERKEDFAPAWRFFRGEARNAIEDMREPTPEMEDAIEETGCLFPEGDDAPPIEGNQAKEVWQAGIGAALKE